MPEIIRLALTAREYDTILAALRYWQIRDEEPHDQLFEELRQEIAAYRGKPLDALAIDALCERMNESDRPETPGA